LKPEHKILIVGCGNANFSEDLYDAGYKNIWNIDISKVVIDQMAKRNFCRKRMKYEVMDCCNLKYEDNFFDVIIDKSTIDAILCGDNAFLNTALMLKEGQRTLKEEGGLYIAISYGKPATRSFHFERKFLSWTLKEFIFFPVDYKTEQEKEEKSHYIYICTKNKEWKEVYQKNFEPEIIKLILYEKNQAIGKESDSENDVNIKNLAGSKISEDIAKAKS
jgi:ubiquinone/menaquinone biosynthesis C-methylase UbiE